MPNRYDFFNANERHRTNMGLQPSSRSSGQSPRRRHSSADLPPSTTSATRLNVFLSSELHKVFSVGCLAPIIHRTYRLFCMVKYKSFDRRFLFGLFLFSSAYSICAASFRSSTRTLPLITSLPLTN